MAPTLVVDPHGNEWVVRRRWIDRRLRWRGKRGAGDLLDGADVAGSGGDLPVVGGILVAIALLLIAVAAVMLLVPAVVFVVELLIIVAIVGFGLVGRVLFGRPWTVEAQQRGGDQQHEWTIPGWHASGELVASVAEELRTTGLPPERSPQR